MTVLRNIGKYAVVTLALMSTLLTQSCADDMKVPYPDEEKQPEATLRLTTGSQFSRGDSHYDDDQYGEQTGTKQEEAIKRIDLFFYEEQKDDVAPFYHYHVDVNHTTTADIVVKVPVDMLSNFKDDAAYVYALVNMPSEIKLGVTVSGKPATMANLRELWVTESGFVGKSVPSDFVMRGGAKVNLEGSGRDAVITGAIMLERLASKMRLFAGIEETIYLDINGKTLYRFKDETEADWIRRRDEQTVEIWHPVPKNEETNETNVSLYAYNIATNGRLDGFRGESLSDRERLLGYDNVDRSNNRKDAVRKISDGLELNDYNEVEDSEFRDIYPYTHQTAYYSYPNVWDSSDFTEQHRTYVILSVPWRREDNGDGLGEIYQVCYYQIPVNVLKGKDKDLDMLDPNTYYRIKINIGMLGSKDLGTPLEIEASYEALDWKTADVDVNIKGHRYLVVNQTEWTMNNTSVIQIPFSSSHTTEITECYVNYFRYYDPWGTDKYKTTGHNKSEFDRWVALAKDAGYRKTGGEGLLTLASAWGNNAVDGKLGDLLYYKDEYFYDEYYDDCTYYVGHEHPRTFQPAYRAMSNYSGYSTAQQDGWRQYREKYDIDKVYDYSIDNENHIITFNHPLVQWEEIRNQSGRIVGYAPVKNPRTDRLWDEFSRCEIVIKLRHVDWTTNDGLFQETIYITQYPGVYIEVSHHYGKPSKSKSDNYIYVNGGKNGSEQWNAVNNLETFAGSNNNPNMYVIHTTQLSEDNERLYEIGDPRTLYYNNYLYTENENGPTYTIDYGWLGKVVYPHPNARMLELVDVASNEKDVQTWNGIVHGEWYMPSSGRVDASDSQNHERAYYTVDIAKARDVYTKSNNTRILQYYYPTDETTGAGSKENFIAPVFRIASSFGKVQISGRPEARRRCATYQEAGRPAGRWRIPTKAEVTYIAQLSADKKIPILFGASTETKPGYYWTANGGINADGNGKVYDNEGNKGDPGNEGATAEEKRLYPYGSFAVRCVYDEWYWTKIDEQNNYKPNPKETTFYWGDMKKDNTQVNSLLRSLTTR